MNRYLKSVIAITSMALVTELLVGCAPANESASVEPDAPSLTTSENKPALSLKGAVAPSDTLTCGAAEDSKDEFSDTATGAGNVSETDRAAAARPCNRAELSIAADHCSMNHTGGYDPIANGYWPCEITGCMVRGNHIVYSWNP